MARTTFTTGSLIALLTIALLAVEAAEDGKCPVSGKPTSSEHWIVSEGKRIYFCCENCPAAYIKQHANRLTEAQRGAHWDLIFNGKDLAGFQKPTREGKWEVRDGVLIGHGGPGVLATERKFASFQLSADIRVRDTAGGRGNSGIFIRSSGLTAQRDHWPDGPEIQVDHGDPEYWTGSIWKTARARKVNTKDGEWFTLRIEAAGRVIRVWVNGELTTEHVQDLPVRAGPIAIQVHHPTDVVELKNLKIRELRES